MSQIRVYTSAALNYIPKVRMLFKSLRKNHPEWKLYLALADELRPGVDLTKEPFDEIVPINEMDIPDWRGWAFCHRIVELSTAIKPFMLARLMNMPETGKVIYLDPDMVVFSRLDDIVEALDHANVVLTPHQTTPEQTLSAIIDNEICSLKHGIYNLGFLAVAATETGQAFAQWWCKRIYHFCRDDIPNGLFTDQRWIDLVPAFFSGVAIMRSSRHNVATWNLTTRDFTCDASGNYLVDGQPLGFYHFTGFDSGDHEIMAAKNAVGNQHVVKLIQWYTKQIEAVAKDPLTRERWAFDNFSDDTAITPAQRLVYRERVDLQRTFSDPFEADGYLTWWKSQGKIEYPDLCNAENNKALAQFASTLSPGYRAGSEDMNWAKAVNLLKRSIIHPKSGVAIGKRGWEVIRNEGLRGIKRRLTS